MKKLYLFLALLVLLTNVNAFKYMGNNTLRVTNSSGNVNVLQHNDSMNLSNSTYHMRLEAPDTEISIDMVEEVISGMVLQLILGVVIIGAAFYLIYQLFMNYI